MAAQQRTFHTKAERDLVAALLHALRLRCPSCGLAQLFRSYLKPVDQCSACGEALHHHRADDAPAYFTMLIVGHVLVPAALLVETAFRPLYVWHFLAWGPLAVVLSLTLLPLIKSVIIALQWALFMHGFDPQAEPELAAGPTPADDR